MGAIEDLIEAAESAFGTIAKWADDRCPVEKWEGLLDAARAELAERGPERVVEVLEISPEHRDGKYRFHVFYTEGDQGSISPDGLRALGLCGPCRLAIRRLPDAPKPDEQGVALHPVVKCKLQPRMLVWHDHRQSRLCIDFEPKGGE